MPLLLLVHCGQNLNCKADHESRRTLQSSSTHVTRAVDLSSAAHSSRHSPHHLGLTHPRRSLQKVSAIPNIAGEQAKAA